MLECPGSPFKADSVASPRMFDREISWFIIMVVCTVASSLDARIVPVTSFPL
jgi:hypothetical protein